MAGRARTRAKQRARGECCCPAHGCPIHKPKFVKAESEPASPASPEWMVEQAKKVEEPLVGEIMPEPERDEGLKPLLPRAYEVLSEQLYDEDQRVRQKAALEVIDRTKGKAAQNVKIEGAQVHTIQYQSAAWTFGRELDDEDEPPALPPAA